MYSYVMYVCMIVCMDGIALVLLEYTVVAMCSSKVS